VLDAWVIFGPEDGDSRICSSEISVKFYQTTQHNFPVDSTLQNKSYFVTQNMCRSTERVFFNFVGRLTALRFTATGTPVAVKRRAVESVDKVKFLPVYAHYISPLSVLLLFFYSAFNFETVLSVLARIYNLCPAVCTVISLKRDQNKPKSDILDCMHEWACGFCA
jgi:hypothetical protein